MNNELYDKPKQQLWTKLDDFFKGSFTRISNNKKRGMMQSDWAVARMGNSEKRLSYRVTII